MKALNFGMRRVAARLSSDPAPDGELLSRFLASRDEAAFALLVRRHAGMVFGTCRRVLGNSSDADDAFQAAFVVLVRKAHSLTGRACVGNFLYGVAFHTALKARAMATKRRAKEAKATRSESADAGELTRVLDEELANLPDKYREPVVLCELDGVSRKDAASRLGIPEGTVSSRLATAHRMLHKRLAARGFAAVAVATVLGNQAFAVPEGLTEAAVRAAADGPPAGVTQLVSEVSKMLLWNKLKTGVVLTGALLVCGIGFGLAAKAFADDKPAVKAPAPKKDAKKPDDAKLLQGKWTTKAVTWDPPFPVPPGAKHTPAQHVLTFAVKDLTWVTFVPDDVKTRSEQIKPYKLDQTTSPKELTSGDMECVYELDGDTLKVAMYFLTPGRPKGFNAKDSPPGKGHIILIELTREKEEPKKEEKLLGKWKQSGMSAGGSKIDLGEGERHWIIGQDEIRFTTTDPLKHGGTLRYVSSADRTPLELTTTNEQGEKRHSIYKLDGDTLTVAFFVGSDPKNPPPAPKGFTEKDVGAEAFKTLYLVTYERVKDDKPEADKGYSLKNGEGLKLIPAPFPEEREEIYTKFDAAGGIQPTPPHDTMLMAVNVKGGKVSSASALTNRRTPGAEKAGQPLGTFVQYALRIDRSTVLDPDGLLDSTTLDADVVLDRTAAPADLVAAFKKELKAKAGIDLTLEMREVETQVVVISGKHALKADPPADPSRPYDTAPVVHLFAADKVQHPNGLMCDTTDLATQVATFLGRPVIDESDLKKKSVYITVRFHTQYPETADTRAADRDPAKVLKNLEGQTGLTFKIEKRTVKALVVAKADKEPAWKAEFRKAYGLKDGQLVRRVALPFPDCRAEYLRDLYQQPKADFTVYFTKLGWKDDWTVNAQTAHRVPAKPEEGVPLDYLLDATLGFPRTRIEGTADMLAQKVTGDWVVRAGADPEKAAGELEAILRKELQLPVTLSVKESEEDVFVLSGKYAPDPLDGKKAGEIEVYAVYRNDGTVGGRNTGTLTELAAALERHVGHKVAVEKVANEPKQVSWHFNDRKGPSTQQENDQDHDAPTVLGNIAAQTGLTFKLEKRKVRVLVVKAEK